ncbi:MAG: hypothetical protein AAB503_02190 [Patescibacteria group bacterium]
MKKKIIAFLAVVFLTTMSCANPDNNVIGPPDVTVPQAPVLNVSLVAGSGASPTLDQVVSIGEKDKVYFAVKLVAQGEPIKIRSLKLTAAGKNLGITTLKNIRLYESSTAGTPVASAPQFDSRDNTSVTWSATDNILSAPVPIAGITLYIKADIASAGQGRLGDDFKFMIADTSDIKIKGSVTGLSGKVIGTPFVSGITRVVPQKVVIEAVSPKTATTIGTASGQIVGVFKVTNNGNAPISIGKSVRFSNAGVSKKIAFALYVSAMGGSSSDSETYIASASINDASSTIDFNIGSLQKESSVDVDCIINGGTHRYLTIKTNGTAENNNTFQLSVSALGNISYKISEADLGYDANLDGDLNDTISGLCIDGTPSLATVTVKN